MHVAIIMDGNGRWATRRGLPRAAGHRAGAEALTRVAEAAAGLGVVKLTVFAFSSDNWRRPAEEVGALMDLFAAYLGRETRARGRLSVIGRRDRLPPGLARAIACVEKETAEAEGLHLRIALDYSARDAISRALAEAPQGFGRDALGRLIAQGAGDVDLLIRTGGEQRLSDFLLWECAYAELAFLDAMWPDFTADDLAAALADFRRRERRFGGLAPVAA